MNVVELIAELEECNDLHTVRLLILLDAFSEEGGGYIGGLTKLAKLDFLLRYPVMLQRALLARKRSIRDVQLEEHERLSVESEMVRYRFGPWDHRYRQFLNLLVARGLANVNIKGRTVIIALTERGHTLAKEMSNQPLFEPYVRRSRLLKRHFDLTATNLMRFIYETFPEIVSMRPNEVIHT